MIEEFGGEPHCLPAVGSERFDDQRRPLNLFRGIELLPVRVERSELTMYLIGPEGTGSLSDARRPFAHSQRVVPTSKSPCIIRLALSPSGNTSVLFMRAFGEHVEHIPFR